MYKLPKYRSKEIATAGLDKATFGAMVLSMKNHKGGKCLSFSY
jgi:hypothetical protein